MNATLLGYKLAATWLPRSPEWLSERFATIAGWVAWSVAQAARQAVQANLRVVLDREPSADETRQVFVTSARNYVDLFALPHRACSNIESLVDIVGWEHLDRAMSMGRGALVASLHLGNIEVVAYAATQRGLKVVVPVERIEPPELLTLMNAARQRSGITCWPVGSAAFAAMRSALRSNALIGIGADRVTLGEGQVVQFCGRPAIMPVAAALLATRLDVPLLPVATYRRNANRFQVAIGPPIELQAGDKTRRGVIDLTERLLVALETFLRREPTQWVVFRRVWDLPPSTRHPG